MSTVKLRRSILFMPGDSYSKIEKATTLDVDSIVMDLEDGVAFIQKDEARQVTTEALQTLNFGGRERLVRLNPPDEATDISTTLVAKPNGYILPKTETATQIQHLSDLLDTVEATYDIPNGSTYLIALIETALGVMNLKEIALASPRMRALAFGAEDYASNVGAIRTKESLEVFYARSAVVATAAAYGLDAIDQVFFDLYDEDGLKAECEFARQLGYTGKFAIHPKQVEPINQVFIPSTIEINYAQRLLTAYKKYQQAGVGVFVFEGKMVDRPVIRAAKKVVALANAVAKKQRE